MTADDARMILERVRDVSDAYATAAINAGSCRTKEDFRAASKAREHLEIVMDECAEEISRRSVP